MSDFQLVRGFEDVWRPPVARRARITGAVLSSPDQHSGAAVRARLVRLVNRAPEVMVKVTGRTRDPAHLKAHLDYISRNGELPLEAADGAVVSGRGEVAGLATDWSAEQLMDRRTRTTAPYSHSIVLSMPAGTDPSTLRDAARAFASEAFAERHDYVLTLHTDTPRPHVHLAVCSRGRDGERLNPKKTDLEAWRQAFAQALRDRGTEAEATPRRARGVTRKPERGVLRRIRLRNQAGRGEAGLVRQAAYRQAARAAFQGESAPTPWERLLADRQMIVRSLYLAQARLLRGSVKPLDRDLGSKVEAFVNSMPAADSQRLALARELRAANTALDRPTAEPEGRHRTR